MCMQWIECCILLKRQVAELCNSCSTMRGFSEKPSVRQWRHKESIGYKMYKTEKNSKQKQIVVSLSLSYVTENGKTGSQTGSVVVTRWRVAEGWPDDPVTRFQCWSKPTSLGLLVYTWVQQQATEYMYLWRCVRIWQVLGTRWHQQSATACRSTAYHHWVVGPTHLSGWMGLIPQVTLI